MDSILNSLDQEMCVREVHINSGFLLFTNSLKHKVAISWDFFRKTALAFKNSWFNGVVNDYLYYTSITDSNFTILKKFNFKNEFSSSQMDKEVML